MLFRMENEGARKKAMMVMMGSGIHLSQQEQDEVQVDGYGCKDLKNIGTQRAVYVDSDQIYAADVVLFPRQTFPEISNPTREVTLRCREGKFFLYTEGEQEEPIQAKLPKKHESGFTVFREIVMEPGSKYTVRAGQRFWMQGGDHGALYQELSGRYDPNADVFSDKSCRHD